MKRGIGTLYKHAHRLQLEKSEAYKQRCREAFLKNGMMGRFGVGHKSYKWNKGMKGLYTPGSEKGWFKKGHVSRNALYDGAIIIRQRYNRYQKPYKWIRVDKKWRMLHVVVWEKLHGKAPEGMIVTFKNGDSMDVTIENLECITRAESMERTRNTDEFIAKCIATGKGRKVDRKLYHELLQRPELLQVKRQQLTLQRILKHETRESEFGVSAHDRVSV